MKTVITEETNINQMENDVSFEEQKTNNYIEPEIHSVKILDGELFSYQLSMECTKEMQTRTRLCVQPLMLSWKNIRQQRPMLRNVC